MNAALRFRLVAILSLLGSVFAFNVFSTDRALWQAPTYIASGAFAAGAIALLLARWVQAGDAEPPPRWRIELLTGALAIPLIPIVFSLQPWLLIAFNDTPRSMAVQLVSREPVKGCAMKVWLRGIGEAVTPALNGEEKGRCFDGVEVDRNLRAGDPGRIHGRESWAGFVADQLQRARD